MKKMELCVLEAAVNGDHGMTLEAFTINPQIVSGENAKRILDGLLIAHKKYLPQFKDKIEELEKKALPLKIMLQENSVNKDYKNVISS